MEVLNSNILSNKRSSYFNSKNPKNLKGINLVAELDKILKKIEFLEQFVSKSRKNCSMNCKRGHSEQIIDRINEEITNLVKSINSSKKDLDFIEKEKTELYKNIRETEKKTIIEHKRLKNSALKIDELKNENLKLKEKIEKDLFSKANKKKLEINKKEKLLFELQQEELAIFQEKNNLINYIKNLEIHNLEIIDNTLVSVSKVRSQLESQIKAQKSVCESLKSTYEYINNQKVMVDEDIRGILEMRADYISVKEEYEKELELIQKEWWLDTNELVVSGLGKDCIITISESTDKYLDYTIRYFYLQLTKIIMLLEPVKSSKIINSFKKIINNITQKVFDECKVKKYLNKMFYEIGIIISDNDLEKLKENHVQKRNTENHKDRKSVV